MPAFDLVIRAATIVDGSGSDPFDGDIAVRDGLVVEVGTVGGRGRREIDAAGALVAPGFVDIHTHYDGQVTWDNKVLPSSWHGVTTVVMGNCGVGFAPVRAQDHDRLIDLMEGVEDIPGVALREGVPWHWETFPEYLDFLAARQYDMDIATQVPHAALRVYVMGDRALAKEAATAGEIQQMARITREAIEAGALGFTTSRTLNHKSLGGELTPSYGAGADELVAIAQEVGRSGRGVLQLVSDFYDLDADFALISRMMEASGRPMSISLLQTRDRPDNYRHLLDFLTQANREGKPLLGQVASRGLGILLGLQCTLNPFMTNAVWIEKIAGRPAEEQASLMRDPSTKQQILAAHTEEVASNLGGGSYIHRWEAMFEFTDPPTYEPDPLSSIAAISEGEFRQPEEVAYDIISSRNGMGMIYMPFSNYAYGSLDVVHEMLAHEHTVPGLSDGGAHVGTVCDASFATTLLQHWVRDRSYDRFDAAYVVRQQSHDTARAVGLQDRGLLLPGYRADMNVIDLAALNLRLPEVHFDLPAGGKRFLQRADGYLHTFVAGVETYAEGQHTGELPGRLVRS